MYEVSTEILNLTRGSVPLWPPQEKVTGGLKTSGGRCNNILTQALVTDLLLHREILDFVTSLLIGLEEERDTSAVQYLPPPVLPFRHLSCVFKKHILRLESATEINCPRRLRMRLSVYVSCCFNQSRKSKCGSFLGEDRPPFVCFPACGVEELSQHLNEHFASARMKSFCRPPLIVDD